jgi:very-short-patch-repair endonuclease
MLRLLRRAGVTGYETNARIHGYEVDFLWRETHVAVEVDGYDAHSGRIAFERDRLKAATLNAHGLRVMPITPRQLRDDPGRSSRSWSGRWSWLSPAGLAAEAY